MIYCPLLLKNKAEKLFYALLPRMPENLWREFGKARYYGTKRRRIRVGFSMSWLH